MRYCSNCGAELNPNQDVCLKCGVSIQKERRLYDDPNAKSKIAAGLFGIFLGAFGVHNFYLGYKGKAITQLLLTILTCGFLSFVSAIWGFIEGVLIISGSIKVDAYGNYLKD